MGKRSPMNAESVVATIDWSLSDRRDIRVNIPLNKLDVDVVGGCDSLLLRKDIQLVSRRFTLVSFDT